MPDSQSMATIRDVARHSGVSVATVSYVLNNGPRAVRPETRRRVLAAIRELDYHPNALARGLARRRMNTLGILFGIIEPAILTNPYASAVLQGILSASAEAGYNVTIFTERWVNAERSAAPFRDRRADGLLLVAPPTDTDMIPGLASLDLPLVVISSPTNGYGVPAVDVDNALGARLATGHLLSLGHRKIAHLMGDPNLASVPARRDGFRRALQEAGIEPREDWIVPGRYDSEVGYEHACELLSRPDRPTAIFAGNDVLAIATLRAARDLGLNAPRDLSVVGFDDIPAAALVTPPLTTIRQPLAEIGSLATQLLIQRMEGKPVEAFTRVQPPRLVVRASTGPPA